MKPYVSYGPGHSGNYDTLEEAQARVDINGGKGAVYIRIDIAEKRARAWKTAAKTWRWSWFLANLSHKLKILKTG